MEFKNLSAVVAAWCIGATSLHAAASAITSVAYDESVDGFSAVITSITVSTSVYTASNLAPGESTGGGTTEIARLETISDIDDFDMGNGLARGSGSPSWVTVFNGGLYQDTNDEGFDFFLFERSGNDLLSVRATYSLDNGDTFTVGALTTLAVAGDVSQWGASGYSDNQIGDAGGSQPIVGIAFRITDLLDSNSLALPNSAVISQIEFFSSGLDPMVLLSAVPEPSTVGLAGIALVCLAARRSRKSR